MTTRMAFILYIFLFYWRDLWLFIHFIHFITIIKTLFILIHWTGTLLIINIQTPHKILIYISFSSSIFLSKDNCTYQDSVRNHRRIWTPSNRKGGKTITTKDQSKGEVWAWFLYKIYLTSVVQLKLLILKKEFEHRVTCYQFCIHI